MKWFHESKLAGLRAPNAPQAPEPCTSLIQMQGKTLKGVYHDGPRSVTLENSNAYFNDHMNSKGEI